MNSKINLGKPVYNHIYDDLNKMLDELSTKYYSQVDQNVNDHIFNLLHWRMFTILSEQISNEIHFELWDPNKK